MITSLWNQKYFEVPLNVSSVQFSPLNRLCRRGDMMGDSAEIFFQSFQQEALVSSSGMGRDVHSLTLSIQRLLCRLRRHPLSKVSWRVVSERRPCRVTCPNHASFRLWFLKPICSGDQRRDQSKRTEAWNCHKLQVPGLSYNWWGFQARDTLQDSTGNNSTDKVENQFGRQEYFSQFQDTTDALPCHIHLPACLWIMDPHSRALKKKYKPWKWVGTAGYYASHTKTMLPTRKSVPRSSRQSDHTKTPWPS